MKPLVSIIIPAYNAERYIARAIKSCLNQTYSDIEVIVVDDGSTDNTAKIVKLFKDECIRYLYQENKDVGAARSYGIRESRGKYITFLDADDEYLPEKVQKQVEFLMQNPEYDAVYCYTLQYYPQNPKKLLKRKGEYPLGNIFPYLLHSSVINPNAIMIRKERLLKVGMFDERPDFPEDWELWLRMARQGCKFGFIDQGLVKIEMRPDSKSTASVLLQAKLYLIEVFERLFSEMSDKEREQYKTDKILEDLRWKTAIVAISAKNKKGFNKLFSQLPLTKKILLWLANIIPIFILSPMLKYLWRWHQERKYILIQNL